MTTTATSKKIRQRRLIPNLITIRSGLWLGIYASRPCLGLSFYLTSRSRRNGPSGPRSGGNRTSGRFPLSRSFIPKRVRKSLPPGDQPAPTRPAWRLGRPVFPGRKSLQSCTGWAARRRFVPDPVPLILLAASQLCFNRKYAGAGPWRAPIDKSFTKSIWRDDLRRMQAGSEVPGKAQLKTVVRTAGRLSGNHSEVEGQVVADFVVSADLLLRLASAQGKVPRISAVDLDSEIEFLSELPCHGSAACEDRPARLDAHRARQRVAREGGTGVQAEHVLGGECLLEDAIQVVVDQAGTELRFFTSGGRLNVQAGRDPRQSRSGPFFAKVVLDREVGVAQAERVAEPGAARIEDREQRKVHADLASAEQTVAELDGLSILAKIRVGRAPQ